MDDRGNNDPLERVTHEDEAREQFEKAAEAAREGHADPRPDHGAGEVADDTGKGREAP